MTHLFSLQQLENIKKNILRLRLTHHKRILVILKKNLHKKLHRLDKEDFRSRSTTLRDRW